jgi:hypothetical protein
LKGLQSVLKTKLDINLYDTQHKDLEAIMTDQISKLRKQEMATFARLQNAERDLRGAEHELKRLNEELNLKTPIEEAGKLWRNFKNFAEYKDLKSLYNKVIPEIDRH